MLTKIPANTLNKNTKSVYSKKSLNFARNNSFAALKSSDLSACIKRSKMPVISAIVPPETPGMTLAPPTPKPFKKLKNISLKKSFIHNAFSGNVQSN